MRDAVEHAVVNNVTRRPVRRLGTMAEAATDVVTSHLRKKSAGVWQGGGSARSLKERMAPAPAAVRSDAHPNKRLAPTAIHKALPVHDDRAAWLNPRSSHPGLVGGRKAREKALLSEEQARLAQRRRSWVR